jgi:formylglycine-generating enzyme
MKTRWMMMAGLLGATGMAQASYVTIGHANNAAQSASNRSHSQSGGDSYGAVGYTYQISKYQVTIADWKTFYDASDIGKQGTFNSTYNYWNDGTRNVGTTAPAVRISFHQAAQYCNWLTTGDAASGAYTINTSGQVTAINREFRNASGWLYALPTENEWFKAAYFKANGSGYSLYAFGLDTAPGVETDSNYGGTGGIYSGTWAVGTGNVEQNGTYDMMGNVWEWMEDSSGVLRGGSCYLNENNLRSSNRNSSGPSDEYIPFGFRVVAIPEPATALLLALGGGIAWLARLKQRL